MLYIFAEDKQSRCSFVCKLCLLIELVTQNWWKLCLVQQRLQCAWGHQSRIKSGFQFAGSKNTIATKNSPNYINPLSRSASARKEPTDAIITGNLNSLEQKRHEPENPATFRCSQHFSITDITDLATMIVDLKRFSKFCSMQCPTRSILVG